MDRRESPSAIVSTILGKPKGRIPSKARFAGEPPIAMFGVLRRRSCRLPAMRLGRVGHGEKAQAERDVHHREGARRQTLFEPGG